MPGLRYGFEAASRAVAQTPGAADGAGIRHEYVTSWGYRCPNAGCSAQDTIHRSAQAEQLHLGRSQFGRDVVVQAGYWRFWQHLTVTEIHERLSADLHLPICEREVLHLLGDFLALLRAGQPAKLAALRPQLTALGGLMVGIDGMQPEKGNLCLYVLREPRLGLTLLAESLSESSADAIQSRLLAPLQALAHNAGPAAPRHRQRCPGVHPAGSASGLAGSATSLLPLSLPARCW